jgi:hypothetical protein
MRQGMKGGRELALPLLTLQGSPVRIASLSDRTCPGEAPSCEAGEVERPEAEGLREPGRAKEDAAAARGWGW